jgi:hypothetical protein
METSPYSCDDLQPFKAKNYTENATLTSNLYSLEDSAKEAEALRSEVTGPYSVNIEASPTFVTKMDIRKTDVLLGRGKSHQKHSGNIRYQGKNSSCVRYFQVM